MDKYQEGLEEYVSNRDLTTMKKSRMSLPVLSLDVDRVDNSYVDVLFSKEHDFTFDALRNSFGNSVFNNRVPLPPVMRMDISTDIQKRQTNTREIDSLRKTKKSKISTIPDDRDILYKNSCQSCTSRRVKCSGRPGPCNVCKDRGHASACVFELKKKPGPKKRNHTPVLNFKKNNSKSLTFIQTEDVFLSFKELSISLRVRNTILDLKSSCYLALTTDTFNDCYLLNDTYAKSSITKAARLWVEMYSDSKVSINEKEFIRLMQTYQESSISNHRIDRDRLHEVFWLSGASFGNSNMSFKLLSLVFMWLGHGKNRAGVHPNSRIQEIFKSIKTDLEIRESFIGFSSKKHALNILKENKVKSVIYLLEGHYRESFPNQDNQNCAPVLSVCNIENITRDSFVPHEY